MTTLQAINGGKANDIELPGTKHIPLDLLKVDEAYQRDLKHAFVEKIAREFNPILFGALEVSERDGFYWVIDGQHRLAALHLMDWPGNVKVPCHVRRHLAREKEASHFSRFNTMRRKPTPYDLFRADRVALDEAALEVQQVLADLELRPVPTDSTSERGLRAIGTVRAIHQWHGPGLLERVLRISLAAWPNDIDGRSGMVLDALAAFIVTHAGRGVAVDDEALVKACAKRPAGQWSSSGGMAGVPIYKSIAADLQDPYNKIVRSPRTRVEVLVPSMFSKRPRRGRQQPIAEAAAE